MLIGRLGLGRFGTSRFSQILPRPKPRPGRNRPGNQKYKTYIKNVKQTIFQSIPAWARPGLNMAKTARPKLAVAGPSRISRPININILWYKIHLLAIVYFFQKNIKVYFKVLVSVLSLKIPFS